jgi:hypothetical protein
MSDAQTSAFGRFVPGFDFLQNLAKGAGESMPQVPGLSNWIAPTLSVEEIDKRISELRAVQFWLEQNGRALAATVQALEVQKMTLATLQGMDLSFSELAQSMRVRPAETSQEPAAQAAPGSAEEPSETSTRRARRASTSRKGGDTAAGVVDPLQWWTALTQQFQEIAATALKETGSKTAPGAPGPAAQADTRASAKSRSPRKRAPAPAPAARKSQPRKPAGR